MFAYVYYLDDGVKDSVNVKDIKHFDPGARGKVFYVGGAVCVCVGGGGGSQFLPINITPNRNRKSCYSLRTFMRSC